MTLGIQGNPFCPLKKLKEEDIFPHPSPEEGRIQSLNNLKEITSTTHVTNEDQQLYLSLVPVC